MHFGIFAKPDGDAAFDAPPANAVRDRPDFALDHLHILDVASQRDAFDIARNIAFIDPHNHSKANIKKL